MKYLFSLLILLAIAGCNKNSSTDAGAGGGDGGGGGGGGPGGTRLTLSRERSMLSLRSMMERLSRQSGVPLTDSNVTLAIDDAQVALGTRTSNTNSNRTVQTGMELVYPFCNQAWNNEYASRNSEPVLGPNRIYTAIVLYDNTTQIVPSVEQFFLQRVYSRFIGVTPEPAVLTALTTTSTEVKGTLPTNTLDGLKNWAILMCVLCASGMRSITY